jgi:hypothetical protein
MNRASLNTYSINGTKGRGGPLRVAADLIAEAFIVAQARVWRRFNEVVEGVADIGPTVGRRMTRGIVGAEASAVILLGGVRLVRDLFAAVGQSVIALVGRAGKRDTMSPEGSASVDLVGRVFRRQPAQMDAQAQIEPGFKLWSRAPTVFVGAAEIALTARSFTLRFLRAVTGFFASAFSFVLGRIDARQPTAFVGEARVRLAAGVQNDFPYDEDAPLERTFVVAPENNLFYVVS